MTSIKDKANYVRSQKHTRTHHCHWPNCERQVPPAMWGCTKHWFALPRSLRNKIWATYQPGQEIKGTPSREYLAIAHEVQAWIFNKYPEEKKANAKDPTRKA